MLHATREDDPVAAGWSPLSSDVDPPAGGNAVVDADPLSPNTDESVGAGVTRPWDAGSLNTAESIDADASRPRDARNLRTFATVASSAPVRQAWALSTTLKKRKINIVRGEKSATDVV
eukprot:m.273261 g.273261  ORF g.273261 m.273261 type:complete len:118 (+) comp40573_c0_seq2:451-804(+)